MFDKIKSMFNNERQKTYGGNTYAGCIGSLNSNPFFCYGTGSYDNTFPSVSRIAESIAEVMPYAVDQKGNKVKQTPQFVKALYNPNAQMSGPEFFEALATMMLVHPTAYVLVWHNEDGIAVPGGNITPKNIAGFTILENPSVIVEGGRTFYRKGSQQYTENEVMAMSLNINPYNITAGYSPSVAAKKWANIDDYIADYQAGFFRNGAIPEGQFVITARDAKAFNDTVDYLQRKHGGAGNNGKVNYVHRPTNDLGQTGNAQIEWIPYGVNNKDLTLDAIFDQTNKKLDMAFGVPQEVKGYLENSNYASAEVADYIFARRVVYPKLVKMWAKFSHELNRITGGLGFALSFDFDMPMLSDEEKVRSEVKQINTNTLTNLINQGYTLESAVAALELPKEYLKLAEAKPQEAENEPELVETEPTTVSQVETSSKCLETPKTACSCYCKSKLALADPNVERVVREYMQKQVDAAIADLNFATEAEAKAFADQLWQELEPIVKKFGINQYDEGYGMVTQTIGFEVGELSYAISSEFKQAYIDYLNKVSLSYTNDTAESIKRVLGQGEVEGWDNYELKQRLDGIMDTDDWRVQRLARTETHRAEQMGGIDSMRQIEKETGVQFVKVWHVNPGTSNHCTECIGLDGTKLPLDNDFGDFPAGANEAADAHPNCSCYLTYEIASTPVEKTVKVTCPSCGRYMFESTGGNAKNVICANSKCKKHYNINVKKGEINAEEIKQ